MEGKEEAGRTSDDSDDLDKCELMDGSYYMLLQERVEPGLEIVRDHVWMGWAFVEKA